MRAFTSRVFSSELSTKVVLASALVASMSLSTTVAQEGPLDRLQQRSADARWREASSEWLPKVPAAVPEPIQVEKNVTDTNVREQSEPKTSTFVEKFNFAESFSLFEPFPEKQMAKQQSQTSGQKQMRRPPAMAFPSREEQAHEEQGSSGQTSKALLTGNRLAPQQADSDAEASPVFQKPIELAQVNQIPPAPKLQSDMPKLRSISEIQPYHDYVPMKKRQSGNQVLKPINDNGPEYLPLPASGTLEADGSATYYHWMAANLTHNPLYFEDVSLERYGHTYPLQELVSVSKFGLQVIGLPYQMALNPVDCEEYPLGYYRPGDCAPFLRYRIPFNKKAAATSAGVYTGLFFLIP